MTDTEIINAMQALLEEHFAKGGLNCDFGIGQMAFTIRQPILHNPASHTAAIISGPVPELRKLLQEHLAPHLVRLVTAKLTTTR